MARAEREDANAASSTSSKINASNGHAPTASTAATAPTPKRKRSDDEPVVEQKKTTKKSKRRKITDQEGLDAELAINTAFGQMDNQLLADYIAQKTKKFGSKLSTVELEDRYIPASAIKDTSSWGKPRETTSYPEFLERFTKKKELSKAPEPNGEPHTLVVAGSGIRAADVTRSLRKFQTKEALVAKLFAKHIKLKEAIEATKTTRINIGVGTPQRIIDLLDDGALSTTSLKRIVIDASYIDQKKRGILDMQDTHSPLIQLLTRTEFKERYMDEKSPLSLLFY